MNLSLLFFCDFRLVQKVVKLIFDILFKHSPRLFLLDLHVILDIRLNTVLVLSQKFGDLESILCGICETAILIFGLCVLVVSDSDDKCVLIFNLDGILARL
jgi:hypothetical protein